MKLALLLLMPAGLALLTGCASNQLDARLARIEQDIRVLADNDRAFQEAFKGQYVADGQRAQQLQEVRRRLEEARAVTDRLEINELGGTSIIRVKK